MSTVQIPQDKIRCPNYIGGNWDHQGEKVDVFSPYNGKVVGEFYTANPEKVAEAIEKAHSAFNDWSKTPIKERTQVMFRFREILIRDINKISNIVSVESGKTLSEAHAGIMKGIEVLEFAISLQNLDAGSKLEVSRGVHCEYRRIPLGVVASVTPFNFPAMVPMWTIPIAITLGNSYVWKPSEKAPLTSTLIAAALEEAGLPKGVLTVLNGDAKVVESIIDHPKVKAVAFVGSSKVAKLVYTRATGHGKRALCLGGAKNHIILLPDADPEICRGISDSFTGCAGQRCMAASVLLAVGNVEKQIEAIKDRASSTNCPTDMGAIITKEQVEFLTRAIEDAISEGATILLDGRQNKPKDQDLAQGYWIGPTILDNVKPNSTAANKELFGPILSIVRVKNISEAMQVENNNDYGNAASVFTNNGAMAEYVASNANAGMVGINIGVPVPREPFSFGGINQSKFGHGDITGINGLNFWSDMKKITTKWQVQKDSNWMS